MRGQAKRENNDQKEKGLAAMIENGNQTNQKLPPWGIMLIVVAAFDAFLAAEYFCVVKGSSPYGVLCGLLIIVDLLIWGILSVAFAERKPDASMISEKELSNAMRLLRYATAVLSFLSLITTANGMKSFVFDTDWKAYLGSFAVQSILVVFSLLLCHFYVMIGTFPHFGKAGKALMLGALTLFFAAALVVSSCFSYVYISGNAYKDTWTGDSETLIQEYLIRETAELKERNTFLSKLFLENIESDIQKTLDKDAKNYLAQKESEVLKQIALFQMENYPSAQEDLQTIEVTPTIERLSNNKKAQPAQLEDFQDSYNAIGWTVMQRAFEDYDSVLQMSSDLANNDAETVESQLEEMSKKLQGIIDSVDYAIIDIDGLKTNFYVNDIIPIKSTFKSTARRFKNFVEIQKDHLDALIAEVNTANTDAADPGEVSVTDQIEIIRRKVYLLDPSQSNLDSAIQDIIGNLSELLEKLSESDVVTTQSVASLTSLTEKINEYGKSLALSSGIQNFQEHDLGQTYSFAGSSGITEDEWKTLRDDDFHNFLSMLHDLPDPLFLDDTYRSEYAQKEYRDTADVLKGAENLRRDLLGQLTNFEESLNYFKYDFRKMAIFSAFVAVFLDLGAFLTGCFLYSARHIQLGKAEVDPEKVKSEAEPEQVDLGK